MIRILAAAIIASILIISGWILLISIKKDRNLSGPYIALDYEPYCNETTYLDVGYLEDTIASDDNVDDNALPEKSPFACSGPQFHILEDGQTLHSILRKQGISEQEIASLGIALKPYLWASDLTPGDCYSFNISELSKNNNIIDSFIIRKLDPNRLPILYSAKRKHREQNNAAFSIEINEPTITEEIGLVQLTVTGTLYQTFNKIPYGNELMQRLLGAFAWEMNMPQEVVPGDQIELLAIKKYALGNFIGYGKIQSVYYRQKNRTLFATFFVSKDKKVQGFYNEKGKTLEKEFAYSPVYETTATSNQMWRMHPIRKIRIRHNGIDYRGNIGTDFFSIADGEVIEKRFDRNVGNMIRVRHKYGVHSEYFHADELVDNVSVGTRVKRGQKLGTIGRTGRLCTGPHLHMGLYKMQGEKRKYIELASLRNVLKPASNIAPAYLTEFNEHVKNLLAMMEKHKPLMADSEK